MTLTVGSLFAGIGGFDLGLERAGMKVIWQSEIDPYASAVLRKHWPGVPNHGDIRSIRAGTVERPDVLCGGFPCQDISESGAKAGIDGERSGLWSEYVRVIRELRPDYVVVENVAALLHRGMGVVLGSLAASGYDAEWDCIPASAVGCPQPRDRVFIVAYPQGVGCGSGYQQSRLLPAPAQCGPGSAGDCGPLHTADCERNLWPADADLVRVADGFPDRAHRIRCLGNAVVPQVVEVIGRAIVEASAIHARKSMILRRSCILES